MEQWHGRLTRRAARRADRTPGRQRAATTRRRATCSSRPATRRRPTSPCRPATAGGLLIADECHGLGGKTLRRALLPQYEERLGLTATLERSDDAVTELLLPYFGGICYRYGFEQAIADGVCARPRVAFVGVPLSAEERAEYVAIEQRLVSARQHLRAVRDMPLEPFGDFLAAVAHLAERDAGADGRAARDYLDAFSKRRQIVAQTQRQVRAAGQPRPGDQGRRRRAAVHRDGARREPRDQPARSARRDRTDHRLHRRRQRREILDDLRVRRLDAVAAPRVLDEGIDVPDANLGVVMSASRTRRQMIQRMGRILRRKRPASRARFVIMFAKDTLEDPANRIERDGFLDEIERISEATGVFDGDALRGARRVPRRARPGGRARTRAPRPLRAGAGCRRYRRGRAARRRDGSSRSPTVSGSRRRTRSHFASPGPDRRRLGRSTGCSTPASRDPSDTPRRTSSRAGRAARHRQAQGGAEAPVDRPGAARDRSPTSGWRISCTGCGEASPPVRVPLAGARPDGGLPLRLTARRSATADGRVPAGQGSHPFNDLSGRRPRLFRGSDASGRRISLAVTSEARRRSRMRAGPRAHDQVGGRQDEGVTPYRQRDVVPVTGCRAPRRRGRGAAEIYSPPP